MGCCESSFDQPDSKQRPQKIEHMRSNSEISQGLDMSFTKPLSDIDITFKVQKIWQEKNLRENEGLDIEMASPLI